MDVPIAMLMTRLYISNMTPSFGKSLFRLPGAEYHSSPPLHNTVNFNVKNSILQELRSHVVPERMQKSNRGHLAH